MKLDLAMQEQCARALDLHYIKRGKVGAYLIAIIEDIKYTKHRIF